VLRAEPFYLSSEVFNTPSVIEWSVDGRKTKGSGGNPYQITIQSTGEAGQASVGFRVQSTTQFLQGAQGGITISI
jgi:hypothetical protein